MTTDEIKQKVIDYANGYRIDPATAVAQIQRESHFNPNANGSSGERGLAQFMPGTWARFGYGDFNNAYDPDYALTAWGAYMTYLLGLFNWDYEKALQGYNGGEGNVQRGTVSTAAQNYAQEILAQAETVTSGGATGSGSPKEDTTNWLLIGAVAAIALISLSALND